MSWRIGIDIGGTFTDFALSDDRGTLLVGKELTTPSDPALGAIGGLKRLLTEHTIDVAEVAEILHATTLVTNVLLERKGAATALLVTQGFGDVLEIGRQKRWDMYDLSVDRPVPLIPRTSVYEIPERLAFDGSVVKPLDEEAIAEVARELQRRGVQAVAVCLLHSYANPSHERIVRSVLLREAPNLLVSISSEVSPVWREYERASTTAVNAYARTATGQYFSRMLEALSALGYQGEPLILQSNGGLASVDIVEQHPIRTLESGPAAGAIMAGLVGTTVGDSRIFSFDMGGTTAKCCIMEDGELPIRGEFEADKIGLKPRSGIPITVPSVDVLEIGAGGGSIARVALGVVAVGPDSAGADPGPVCYRRGGSEPTVTDANLVLGYLDPDYFAGGAISLDREAALAAIKRHIADPLGISATEAAWGIHQLVTLNMENAARAIFAEKGIDPRDYTLVAMGGAGPAHSARMADDLGCRRVIFPASAGVASAVGLMTVTVRFDFAQTSAVHLTEASPATVNSIYSSLESDEAARGLARIEGGSYSASRSADVRYVGQGYEINVPVPTGTLSVIELEAIKEAFAAAYERKFGYRRSDAPVEGITWRLTLSAGAPKFSLPTGAPSTTSPVKPHHTRMAYWPEAGEFGPTRVYRRVDLRAGARILGPAIIEESESTAILPPQHQGEVDAHRNLIVTRTA